MEWFNCDLGAVHETNKCIKVIGVGGGGGNTVDNLYTSFNNPSNNISSDGIDFVAINTDSQALSRNHVPNKIQIAEDGQGAGSDPKRGKALAEQYAKRIEEAVGNAYLVFITAGMGGGTGTGASPVIARIARQVNKDALIIGVVTTPSSSESNDMKRSLTDWGIRHLKDEVNALLIISNDAMAKLVPATENYSSALRATDALLMCSIQSIVSIIRDVSPLNTDFQDVCRIMRNAGTDVIISVGSASGPDRYIKALEDALNSPLLCGRTIKGASGILTNFRTNGASSELQGINEVQKILVDMATPNAVCKHSETLDSSLKEGSLILTIIATDFVDERGDLVTYMQRAVNAGSNGNARISLAEHYNSNEELNTNVQDPDFNLPTFMRVKK